MPSRYHGFDMSRLGLFTIGAAATAWMLGSIACGGGSSPPGSSDPGSSGERITGNERLGWSQAAGRTGDVAGFGYVAYVDGNRTLLNGVSCTSAGSGSFACSSRMPAMSAGAHTLELAAFVDSTAGVIESARSAPFRVTLAAATAGADSSGAQTATEQTTLDGVRVRAVTVAQDVEPPSAMAFAADGSVLLAERRGRIAFTSIGDMADGAFAGSAAADLEGLYVTPDTRGGVLDLVLDPQFDRTRFVYVLYVTAGRDGNPEFEIARFREAGGRLGERVVLFDRLPASPRRPAGALEFGPDGKLYAAFDDGGDPVRALQAGGYSAKVLRLNADGTAPMDRPSPSPVFSSAYSSPRGLRWQPLSNVLWIADRTPRDADELRMVAETARLARGQARAPIALPADTDTSSMTFYRGDPQAPFHGDLFVAGADGLLRIRFDRRDSGKIVATERLFAGLLDNAVSVAVGPDGALYLGARRSLVRIALL
jgi:glucose/arabinose dehydrogenase